jgi:hypothetical protein
MTPLTILFSLVPRRFHPLRSKYSHHHPILETTFSVLQGSNLDNRTPLILLSTLW